MNRNVTGYYLTPSGRLRHAHVLPDYDNGLPVWHDAITPHTTPEIHANSDAWNCDSAVWARANANLPQEIKAQLITEVQRAQESTN